MNQRVTAIGLTAGLLAGAGAGFIIEHAGAAGASSRGLEVAPAATTDTSNTQSSNPVGSTGDDDSARLQSILQPLVDNGTLTTDQMNKVIAALQAADPRGGGDGRIGHGHGFGGPGFGANLDAVATLLGITNADLQTALQGGQTLAQIATAHGKTAQNVIDVLVAEVKAHFAPEVAAGEHTQAEADQMIAAATAQITDMVNNGGFAGRGGRGDGDGDHGAGDAGSGTTSNSSGA